MHYRICLFMESKNIVASFLYHETNVVMCVCGKVNVTSSLPFLSLNNLLAKLHGWIHEYPSSW